MPDPSADPAALRAAMRDDLARTIRAASGFGGVADNITRAVVARLRDRYDLDDWLAHLARRDEEVRSRKDYAEWTRRPR